MAIVFIACSNDDEPTSVNEIEGLIKVQDFTNSNHTIEMYTTSGSLIQGYNNITLRVLDNSTQAYVENAEITWSPVMHMMTKTHSCPKSAVVKISEMKTTYNGYIVFQMAENESEGWDLTFNYTINDVEYTATGLISVPMSEFQTVTVFTGVDSKKYILALIEPQNPEVKINEMLVGLYTMESMMSFPVVENYKINLDPRMPSMGNHSSPNNQNLVYYPEMEMYNGKLSLTMTGYWKLNLILLNEENEVLKGEEVTDTNESSSLYLELEF
jgi:hypothetical protein